MTHWITVTLVSLFAVQWFTFAVASHFRHGSIAWAPTDSYSNRISFTFRLAFRRSYSSSYNCDNSIIQSGSLLGSGDSWTAQCLNYSGSDPQCNSARISDTGFRCTDYSSVEDWSMGENNFTYRFPSVHDKWTVSYTSCCWISLSRYGGGSWLVSAVVNLARRSDTRRINSSPVSRSPAIIRWQNGCPKSIRIANEDPDGDVVRCRWATYSESSRQPDSFPYGILDEHTCVLAYNGSNGRAGTYAVALTLEDFPKGTNNFNSVSPFSAVGLQFLVVISGHYGSCGDVPVFTASTPSDGQCSEVQIGSAYKAVIEVKLADLSKHIVEITTSSPSGMQLTSLRYQRGIYYRNVTWYPNQHQVGQQLFCFKAVDSMRLESEWRCVTILVGLSNTPRVIMGSQQPLNPISKVGGGFTWWSIQFDRVIKKPRSSSYIRLVLLPNGHTVYKVDTLSAYVTISSDHTTLQFATPNAALSMNGSYAVLIDQGAVVGQGCSYDGPPTPGITSPGDWNFTINGVCQVGYYLAAPGFTNCVDINECGAHSRSKRSPHYLWWSFSSYSQYSRPSAFYSLTKSSTYAINPTAASSYLPFTLSPSGLRLVGGSWSGEGRVEIFHNGAWGTVCDDSWGINDARVVCRSLGYLDASRALQSAYFGQGSGQIWLDDVNCRGYESAIERCWHRGWGVHNCGHSEDAGVICSPNYSMLSAIHASSSSAINPTAASSYLPFTASPSGLRLVGGSWSGEGRVEIFHNGAWGTVCDDSWGINDARVVCRSLGYPDASRALQSAYFGQGSGQIWLDDVNCRGYESAIERCWHRGWGVHNCGHNEDAGVICISNYSMSSAIRATPLSAQPFTASTAILPSVSAPAATTSSTRLPSNQSECSNHAFLEDPDRGQGFYNGYNGYYQCDRYLPFGWYRFRGAAGTQMPTTCVGKNRCSTHAPGWLNTSHPSVADGIVSGKVCFHWHSGCCTWSTNIRVRNCSGFYVYELRPPPNCWLRYCGNGGANYSTSSADGVSSLPVITPTAAASNYITPSPSYNIAPTPFPTSSMRYHAQSSSVALPTPLDFQLHIPSDCDQICSNNPGSYSCSCVSGYRLDPNGKSCSDINECLINNGGCSHNCYNIPGSFYCGCPGGTTMAANNLTCVEPGVSVSCAENNMTVSLDKQTFPFFEVNKLHLRYSSCRATQNSTHLLIETPLSGCGTLVNETQDALIFSNEIRVDTVIIGGVITRTHDIKLPFHCRYSRKEMLSLSFKPRNVYFGQEVGYGNFTFKLDFYKSAAFAEAYTHKDYPISVRLNDYIYVRYSVESSADLVIMAENCKATKDGSFYSWPQYNIIQNGCPRDTTLDYSYDPTRRFQRFKIRTFRFFNDYDTVYFHCELLACHRYSPNSRCRKSCLSSKKRKRRGVTRDSLEHGESTTKTILTAGPIRIKEKLKAAGHEQSNEKELVGGVAAAGGIVVIAVIALVVLSIKYRIARRFMDRNKVADLYTAQGEQMGRRNAYIQENDAGQIEDSF